jgi:hypothetical protein
MEGMGKKAAFAQTARLEDLGPMKSCWSGPMAQYSSPTVLARSPDLETIPAALNRPTPPSPAYTTPMRARAGGQSGGRRHRDQRRLQHPRRRRTQLRPPPTHSCLLDRVEFDADFVGLGVGEAVEDGQGGLPKVAGAIRLAGEVMSLTEVVQCLAFAVPIADLAAEVDGSAEMVDGLVVEA